MNTNVQNPQNGNVSKPTNETKEVKIIPVNASPNLDLSLKRIAEASRLKKYLENVNARFQEIEELEFEEGDKTQYIEICDRNKKLFETHYSKVLDKIKSILLEELKLERERTIQEILSLGI